MKDDFEKLALVKGTKGKLFWKERWFSFCSMHFKYEEDCCACNTGSWTNVWKWKIGGLLFKVMPKIWIWWMNRPNSKSRKRIEKWFSTKNF